MRNKMSLIPFAAALLVATAFPGTSSAEVGKRVSVTSGSSGTIAASPMLTESMSVALPTGYKSKSTFLKVTTSYQVGCGGGDSMRSRVDVGDVTMVDGALPFEGFDEDASHQIVSKTYYLVPENQGGPAIAADSMVTLKLTSALGTGCSIPSQGTMTVEAIK